MQDVRDEKLINQRKKPPTCEFHDQDGFWLKTTSEIPAQANIKLMQVSQSCDTAKQEIGYVDS